MRISDWSSDVCSSDLRLDREQPQVEKTVMKNDQQEHRSMNGLDWKTELKVFLNSDINKPAWRDSYKVDSSGSGLRYQALEPDLKVRSIHISREPTGQVTGIEIRQIGRASCRERVCQYV